MSQFLAGRTSKPAWYNQHASHMQWAKETRDEQLAQCGSARCAREVHVKHDANVLRIYKAYFPELFVGEAVVCNIRPTTTAAVNPFANNDERQRTLAFNIPDITDDEYA